ncbi:DUF4130 domain-containing protein [Paraburkholderia sp. PREW-6R]|uniref:DUF4130 domain-containing protein n=1 Tax=Paraburkholderia sp. PREW-6R TaxID=3141544 RepID=UPI0031F58263
MNRTSIEPAFSAWRDAARALLRRNVEPGQVEWIESEREACAVDRQQAAELEGATVAGVRAEDVSAAGVAAGVAAAGISVDISAANTRATGLHGPSSTAIPRELLARLQTAACYRAPDRWALLYRILWRWTHGERRVLDPGDEDGALLATRIAAVERETDDLLLLTLFRRRDPTMGLPEFVGWYEPRHDLLERAAERFAEKMGDSTWMLATPHGAAFWNGMLLFIGRTASEEQDEATHALPPGAMAGEAISSESAEALWLMYYANAFNGERTPMPLRYWRTPPAGPPLPASIARARSRLGAQAAPVSVPPAPPVEYSAMTPPFREPSGPPDACRRCALWRNARQAVAGVGPRRAPIMVVGEQPGEDENQRGESFIGPAGQLLDAVLARAGLERASLYLTYAVKHYKWETLDHQHEHASGQQPNRQRMHRMPARREVEACRYWLDKELAQVGPRVVVTLGPTALKAMSGAHVSLSEYLGQTIVHGDLMIVPTWHPAYALRTAHRGLRDDIVATIADAFRRAARSAGASG